MADIAGLLRRLEKGGIPMTTSIREADARCRYRRLHRLRN
jgi:hypothetical protein